MVVLFCITYIEIMRIDAKAFEPDNVSLSANQRISFEAGTYINSSSAVVMYRLYNPNSGEHFYTGNLGERDNLINAGWSYEGIGWTAPAKSDTPVYRLYNPNAGDHHYTMSVEEKDYLVSIGWKYEGIGWYSDDSKSVPIYRQYNPNAVSGSHNYSVNKSENDYLVSLGWREEGIGWYGINVYIITQYGDYARATQMFYTIEDSAKNLVIIDGGWDYETDAVREVIAKHNNHVNAWIITHPHPDHVDAFNEIAANPSDIVIDEVYTVDGNYDRYKETATAYDEFETYETFMSVINNMDNVHIVREDDIFYCLGLEFKVIHAWDDYVESLPTQLCNNGSMCFIVSGNYDKMMFMADILPQVENEILSRHLDEINEVDYIQLGHHGNWGPTTAFYDNTSPRAVFFDCSRAVFNLDKYDASKLKAYFEGRGIDTYTVETQPNFIVIR